MSAIPIATQYDLFAGAAALRVQADQAAETAMRWSLLGRPELARVSTAHCLAWRGSVVRLRRQAYVTPPWEAVGG